MRKYAIVYYNTSIYEYILQLLISLIYYVQSTGLNLWYSYDKQLTYIYFIFTQYIDYIILYTKYYVAGKFVYKNALKPGLETCIEYRKRYHIVYIYRYQLKSLQNEN